MNNGWKLAGMLLGSMLLAGMLLTSTATMGVAGGSAHADARPTAPSGPPVPGPKANFFEDSDGSIYYEIRNLRTQGCADVQHHSHTPGANVRQYDCEGNQANQLWRLEPAAGTNYYALRNRESLQCLDIESTNPVPPNGTVVEQKPCNIFAQNQRWEFRFIGTAGIVTHNLVSRAGGKCLDLDDGSFGNDKRIQVWNCEAGNNNQLWYLN
ncbi:MAG TPA: RICIN domain-containing protein [Microlunatus sp.]